MTSVIDFIKRVKRTIERSEDGLGVSEEDIRYLSHNRPAPPHAGLYCLACANPLRPDTYACPDCGTPNPVKMSTRR